MAALWTRRALSSSWWTVHACRPLSVGAALGAKSQTKASSLDPVQQLFLDKLKEYRTKSAGGFKIAFYVQMVGSATCVVDVKNSVMDVSGLE